MTGYFTDSGGADRPVLLLVHGWGSDSGTWATLVPFMERYRVITVDVRGHGRSGADDGRGFDPEVIAEDLVAVLDHAGVRQVVAIGHSWGGQLVTALAVTHPDRVAALVVLDPAYGASSEAELRVLRDRWYSPDALAAFDEFAEGAFVPATPPAVRDQVRAGLRATDTRVLADAFVAMYLTERSFGLRAATERYLSRVTARTLSIFADPAAAAWARRLPAAPGSRVDDWPGTGHYLHQEQPERLARTITDWL
ncbi:pimeloyl-ACP methyl ester carboxylesterase [Actinoplanes tereljensis]|uniref:O-methylpimelyl-ACP methylesterase n=1 Tax=Paractinoplanes tereljensis TaxID=571912 RepID=A0A919U0C2_9ACTN|nr:alpha/beta hydrolase [Actinoplanes tereljensis]GIF26737.1 O-methylpimelyl-ACP methylesterase [Actinoplanes tereljensis]